MSSDDIEVTSHDAKVRMVLTPASRGDDASSLLH
jgi:hypothetical protein